MRLLTSILLTVGSVLWLEALITIEWTYPYCLDRSDGPAYIAQGMPLPYWMWNGVVSLEHDLTPHIYVLNVVLLSLLVFPIVRWILNREFLYRPWLSGAIGAIGCFLLVSHVAMTVLGLSVGYYHPTATIGHDGYFSYSELRPIRIGLAKSSGTECTPSRFWYPNGWQHD